VQYVSVGRRFVAILIDSIIVFAVGTPFGDYQHVRSESGMTTYSFHFHGGGALGILLIWLVYYAVMEATLGATVGKLAMGIRVVQEDGSKCTWQGAIVRNLLRIVDALFAYLVAAILVWTSPKRQRLGDRAANTVVIRKGTNAGVGNAGVGNASAGMTAAGTTGGAAGTVWPPASPGAAPIPPPPPPVPPPSPGAGDQPPPQP
jgi:uncharacterized RDD family membrane protein YckC